MAEYNWTKEVDNGKYTIKVAEPDLYGYFEHNELGEERGGGLWFFKNENGDLELQDYDGVFALPLSVAKSLVELGIVVGNDFLD